MSSGSKKGTQIYYPHVSKCPEKRTPSMFPSDKLVVVMLVVVMLVMVLLMVVM
jgi:hypothetical protein